MKTSVGAFCVGLLFAAGLAVAGMTQPGKVTAFLDFFGNWDPSLAFVMVGAISVYAIGSRFVLGLPKPRWAPKFFLPEKKDIDARLIGGNTLFGIGWGLAGFCPGPALTSLATFRQPAWVFVVTLCLGVVLHSLIREDSVFYPRRQRTQ